MASPPISGAADRPGLETNLETAPVLGGEMDVAEVPFNPPTDVVCMSWVKPATDLVLIRLHGQHNFSPAKTSRRVRGQSRALVSGAARANKGLGMRSRVSSLSKD
jgi:hypothetical protein